MNQTMIAPVGNTGILIDGHPAIFDQGGSGGRPGYHAGGKFYPFATLTVGCACPLSPTNLECQAPACPRKPIPTQGE